jgi:hypothetical protein
MALYTALHLFGSLGDLALVIGAGGLVILAWQWLVAGTRS